MLLELADHLCDVANRRLFAQTVDVLRHDSRHEIIPANSLVLTQAIELYRSRTDKDWSLTDSTSFNIMGDRSLTEALTADHHFEQAGFTLLLK